MNDYQLKREIKRLGRKLWENIDQWLYLGFVLFAFYTGLNIIEATKELGITSINVIGVFVFLMWSVECWRLANRAINLK